MSASKSFVVLFAAILLTLSGCSSRTTTSPPKTASQTGTGSADVAERPEIQVGGSTPVTAKDGWVVALKDLQTFFVAKNFRGVIVRAVGTNPVTIEEMNPLSAAECKAGVPDYRMKTTELYRVLSKVRLPLVKGSATAARDGMRTDVKALQEKVLRLVAILKEGPLKDLSKTLQACELKRMQNLNVLLDGRVFDSEIDRWQAPTDTGPSTAGASTGGDDGTHDGNRDGEGSSDNRGVTPRKHFYYSDENVS